jgi:integrase
MGLQKRNGIWVVDKVICGQRVCRSTGTPDLKEAEKFLARLSEQIREAALYGVRPERLFKEAAINFLQTNRQKRSLSDDVRHLNELLPWIGEKTINQVHMGTLADWIAHRQRKGVSAGTINHGLKVVRRILRLAATRWIDHQGLSWLQAMPMIELLKDDDKRKPYPLSWDEQDLLFPLLPEHLRQMALFAVNTGCRDGEICALRWEWEVPVPQLGTSVFVVPGANVKNGDDRVVVLNNVARKVVDERRGIHETYVFTYRGRRILRMFTSSWVRARRKANLEQAGGCKQGVRA